jgi:hypothetical protein
MADAMAWAATLGTCAFILFFTAASCHQTSPAGGLDSVSLRKPGCIAWRIALVYPQKAERFNTAAPKTLISLRFRVLQNLRTSEVG